MANCEVIAVANQKGGVGKSTSVYCIGAGLAMDGKRVLLVDVDPQGDLTKMLGQRKPHELKNAEPQTIRGELTDIRDTLQTMTGKMARTLEQSRTAAQKETGKER